MRPRTGVAGTASTAPGTAPGVRLQDVPSAQVVFVERHHPAQGICHKLSPATCTFRGHQWTTLGFCSILVIAGVDAGDVTVADQKNPHGSNTN